LIKKPRKEENSWLSKQKVNKTFKMASRHNARQIALQTLYELDFNNQFGGDHKAVLEKNVKNSEKEIKEPEFLEGMNIKKR